MLAQPLAHAHRCEIRSPDGARDWRASQGRFRLNRPDPGPSARSINSAEHAPPGAAPTRPRRRTRCPPPTPVDAAVRHRAQRRPADHVAFRPRQSQLVSGDGPQDGPVEGGSTFRSWRRRLRFPRRRSPDTPASGHRHRVPVSRPTSGAMSPLPGQRRRLNQAVQPLHRFRPHPEVRERAPLLPLDQPGGGELLEVVADRRLGQPELVGELAHAHRLPVGAQQDVEDLHPVRSLNTLNSRSSSTARPRSATTPGAECSS